MLNRPAIIVAVASAILFILIAVIVVVVVVPLCDPVGEEEERAVSGEDDTEALQRGEQETHTKDKPDRWSAALSFDHSFFHHLVASPGTFLVFSLLRANE